MGHQLIRICNLPPTRVGGQSFLVIILVTTVLAAARRQRLEFSLDPTKLSKHELEVQPVRLQFAPSVHESRPAPFAPRVKKTEATRVHSIARVRSYTPSLTIQRLNKKSLQRGGANRLKDAWRAVLVKTARTGIEANPSSCPPDKNLR